MLLRDGSIKLFDCLAMAEDVLDELAAYDGVAYYWYNSAFNWCRISPENIKHSPTQISKSEVPEVILLAHMLE